MLLDTKLATSVITLLIIKVNSNDSHMTCRSEWEVNSEVICTYQGPFHTLRWTVFISSVPQVVECVSETQICYNHNILFNASVSYQESNLTIWSVSTNMTEVWCSSANYTEKFLLPVFAKPLKPLCGDPFYSELYLGVQCRTGAVFPKGICVFSVKESSIFSLVFMALHTIYYTHEPLDSDGGKYMTVCELHIPWHLISPGESLQFQVQIYPDVLGGKNYSAISNWTNTLVYEAYSVTRFTGNSQHGVVLDAGSMVKFECNVAGNPPPLLYIVRKSNGTSVKVYQALASEGTVTYVKYDVQCQDEGTYECVLRNDLPTETVQVSVQERLRLMSSSSNKMFTVHDTDSQNKFTFRVTGCPFPHSHNLMHHGADTWYTVAGHVYFISVQSEDDFLSITLEIPYLNQIMIFKGIHRFALILYNDVDPDLRIDFMVNYVDGPSLTTTSLSPAATEQNGSGNSHGDSFWNSRSIAGVVAAVFLILVGIASGIGAWCCCKRKAPNSPLRPSFYPPIPSAARDGVFRPARATSNGTGRQHMYAAQDTVPRNPRGAPPHISTLSSQSDSEATGSHGLMSYLPSAPPAESISSGLQNFSPPPAYETVVLTDVNTNFAEGSSDFPNSEVASSNQNNSQDPPPTYASVETTCQEPPPPYPGCDTSV